MSDADDNNNDNPINPAQGGQQQQQQAQPLVQPDAQQQPQQGLQLHPVVHQQQAPPLQPPQQHFTLMIIPHPPAAAGGAPGAPPAPVANPFAAPPIGAVAGVPLGAQLRPRPPPPPGAAAAGAAAPVRPRPQVIPMQLHINAAGPPPGPAPRPLPVPAAAQAQANVPNPNLTQPVGGFGGVRPAAPAAGPPLPQQNPNPFQGLNAALAQVLPHVGLPGLGNANRGGAAGGGGGRGGGWRLVSVDATVNTTTVQPQGQDQAAAGVLSPQGNMHPLPALGAGMGPPLLGGLPPAFVTEGGGAAAAAPPVTGDIKVTNHYKKSYYYNMGECALDGDDGPPMPTVMQSGVDSTPTPDSTLPLPNLNEARRRLGDAYRLLYTIARIKDKAREQKISFIMAAPGNGAEWVEGNIVNAEILIKRFERGDTEMDALVREMAGKVGEALKGVREGEREGQQSGGGGGESETSAGGGSGTGEGGLTLDEQRSSTRS